MWLSLADERLVEIYKKHFTTEERIPKHIVSLLSQLQKKPYASKLTAVTSLGHLYLTTALSLEDESKHDCVFISQFIDAGKPVISIAHSLKAERNASATRRCSPKEAVDYVDLYVMRLLLEKYGEL